MPGNRHKILLVDDDQTVLGMLDELLKSEYQTILASSGPMSIEKVRENRDLGVVVMDIRMPVMDGITASRKIKEILPEVPIIFHTGYPGDYNEDEIDEREKPFDYVLKGDSIARLLRSVRNAMETRQLKLDNRRLLEYAESNYGIIGKSAAMQEVFHLIRKVAPSDPNVMVFGETGTGKELVARAIHGNSRRSQMKYGILNCNHKSPDLVESDLFGHVKGSFTGAISDRIGLFEYANKGTVFLDDIGDLDITTQAKLLRVLETGEFQSIGDSEIKHADVRVICATHRSLEQMVKERTFREDLYYRLKGILISLPPLRERKEDIPLLIEKFNENYALEQGITPKIFDYSAIHSLIDYNWPGNVRQLLHTIESLIVLSDSDIIGADDVSKYLRTEMQSASELRSLSKMQDGFARNCIIKALHQTGNNVSAAARILQIDRSNLHKLIKRLNIVV